MLRRDTVEIFLDDAHELRSTEITAHDGRSRSTVDLVDLLFVVDLALCVARETPNLEGGTCMPIRNLTVNHHWLAHERPEGVSARPHPINPVSPVKETLSIWNRGRNVSQSKYIKEYRRRISPEILGKSVGRPVKLETHVQPSDPSVKRKRGLSHVRPRQQQPVASLGHRRRGRPPSATTVSTFINECFFPPWLPTNFKLEVRSRESGIKTKYYWPPDGSRKLVTKGQVQDWVAEHAPCEEEAAEPDPEIGEEPQQEDESAAEADQHDSDDSANSDSDSFCSSYSMCSSSSLSDGDFDCGL